MGRNINQYLLSKVWYVSPNQKSKVVFQFRINLEQFKLAESQDGKCSPDSFSISIQQSPDSDRMDMTGLLCGQKTGLESKEKEKYMENITILFLFYYWSHKDPLCFSILIFRQMRQFGGWRLLMRIVQRTFQHQYMVRWHVSMPQNTKHFCCCCRTTREQKQV
jgi:hypothetical protein